MKIRQAPMKKARIEIIPMIDTIFFLLVFFMFTSLSMVKMKGMGVSMPTNAPASHKPAPKAIVTVDKSGDYYINLTKIQPAQLGSLLQDKVTGEPDTVIVVNVAKAQRVQTLIDVMDQVNTVEKPSGDPPAVMVATEPVSLTGQAVGVHK
ncbi:MAG TPA: biopolymer transporter ExbD [Capsulimonadaceae bacterium]|jgi:biopolymer transport protein ExbD